MFNIRKAQAGDEQGIAQVHVDSWKSTYAGLIPQGYLETLSVEKRKAIWKQAIEGMNDRRTLFVAVDLSGTLQGFVAGGVERETGSDYDAEIYAIYLRRSEQGKGLGRLLMREISGWLVENGFENMRLWVLEGNPTIGFYERMAGKRLSHTKKVEFDGVSLQEVAYGWDDVHRLLEA